MVMGKNAAEPVAIRDYSIFLPEKGLAGQVYEFSQTTFEAARQVIKVRMPQKILDLTTLLKEKNGYEKVFGEQEAMITAKAKATATAPNATSKRSKMELNESSSPTSLDEVAVEKGSVMFDLACQEFALLKIEVLELVEMTSAVKLWLQLNIPRIEDGNNFGVSIQNDTVTELARVEDSALMTFENWAKFLSLRAKMVGKMHKHEGSIGHKMIEAAYRRTLVALDEKQLRSVWIGWLDLRNNYAVIYDLIVKNIEKLVNPRSVNATAMY